MTLATREVVFAVEHADITQYAADAIVLKFAQGLYGADAAVARALNKGIEDMDALLPSIGQHTFLPSKGHIGARIALFISVLPVFEFRYEEIRSFAAKALEILAGRGSSIRHVAMTIHGVGYGLDEQEAMQSQLAGLLDGLEAKAFPKTLERLTIVEHDNARVRRLSALLAQAIPGGKVQVTVARSRAPRSREPSRGRITRTAMVTNVGRNSYDKPSMYVLMTSNEHTNDYYRYGVEAPIRRAGYLCERALPTASPDGAPASQMGGGDAELKVALRDFLTRHFNLSELQLLCQDRNIPYEEIGGGGISDRARELVDWLNRRARITEMVSHVTKLRPNISPPAVFRHTQGEQFQFERETIRIDSADLMIADLSPPDATTLLLVGYAWGRGKPVILLAREGQDSIPPSLRSQRCLSYSSIAALEEALEQELARLTKPAAD